MKSKIHELYYILVIFIFVACTKDSEVNVENSAAQKDSRIANFVGKTFSFDEVLEALSTNYKGKDKIALLEFEFLDSDGNLTVSKHSELDGFAAAFVLAMYETNEKVNPQKSFRYSSDDGCTEKQKQKQKCYDITCYNEDGTSTTTRCGGMIGCSSTIKGCLDSGGCVEACRVPPSVMYIPEYDVVEKIDRVLLFPGKD